MKVEQIRETFGHSLRGKTPRSYQFLSRGERINVIAGMTEEGIKALKVVRGTVDGSVYTDFIQEDIVPISIKIAL